MTTVGAVQMQTPVEHLPNRAMRVSLIANLTLFSLCFLFSWRRMNHHLVDIGRELYVAWRVSEGEVLYRDIAYFNGPFSPLVNGLFFKWFGASFATLWIVNFVLAAMILVGIVRWVGRQTNAITAFIAGLAFTFLFAFNHYGESGNYSYIAPYSHEMTHGLLLSLLAISLLGSPLDSAVKHRSLRSSVSGVLLALTFLTKPEIFAALSVGWSTWWLVAICVNWKKPELKKLQMNFLFAGLSAGFTVLAMTIYFSRLIGWHDSWLGVLGGWKWIGNAEIVNNRFYLRVLGTDRLSTKLISMSIQAGGALLWIAAAASIDYWVHSKERSVIPLALFVVTLMGALTIGSYATPILSFFAGFTILAILIVLLNGLQVFRFCAQPAETNPGEFEFWCGLLPWSLFSLALLAKIFFNPLIYHYGFVFVMPISMLLIVVAHRVLQNVCANRWQGGETAIWVLRSAILLDTFAFGLLSWRSIRECSFPVAHGHDLILTSRPRTGLSEAMIVAKALDDCAKRLPPDATLATLPEGATINYFLRKRTPVGYTNYMPIEFAMYGETNIMARFQAAPPDYILLVDRDTFEYGAEFGSGSYGAALLKWIDAHYTEETSYGQPRSQGGSFGIRLMRHHERLTAGPPFHDE